MNHTELRDFPSKTLQLISGLIDYKTAQIRSENELSLNNGDKEDIASLLEFQTQVEYAKMLVLKEEKVLES